MHEFKKVCAVLMSGIIMISLVGCGSKKDETKKEKKSNNKSSADVEKDGDEDEDEDEGDSNADNDAEDIADDEDEGEEENEEKGGKDDADSKKSSGGAYDVGDVITMGKFEQDNDLSNGPEDIEWIVLDSKSNGDTLVISKDALEGLPYNKIFQVTITWEECSLREWLNTDFYGEVFTDEEKAQILVSQVTNPKNDATGTEGGNDTEDKVFLLSLDEVNTYFDSDESRICHPSAYAKGKGLEAGEKTVMEGNCRWWLRSPGLTGSDAARIFEDGSVNEDGGGIDRENNTGVRPVMWINEAGTGDASWEMEKKEGFTTTKILSMIEVYEQAGMTIYPLTAEDLGADKQKYVEGIRVESDNGVLIYAVQFTDDDAAREFIETVWAAQYDGVTIDDSVGSGFMFEVPGAYTSGYCDFLGFMTYHPAQA